MAIAGPNGCGKSTLLNIMAGKTIPDRGKVSFPSGARVGYVLQEFETKDLDKCLLDYVLEVLPDWSAFWREWKEAVNSGDQDHLTRLSQKQEELEHRFGYSPEHEAERILQGLGFAREDFAKPLKGLSGGWRERVKLARVLLQGADILLLDEPTNHLDLEAVLWLEEYLWNFKGILAFVVHDRYFVDRIATHVLYMGFNKHYQRPGNLSQFFEWHADKEGYKERLAEKLEKEINHKQSFVDKFRYKASKASLAQSRIKQIEGLRKELEGLQADKSGPTLNFSWPEPQRCNKVPVSGNGLSFGFEGNALFQGIDFSFLRGQKVALVGPNGRGKSTLLKIIAGEIPPQEGGVRSGNNVILGYYAQHQTETLQLNNTVLEEVRRLTGCTGEEQIRSVLGLFLLGEKYWDKEVRSLSGGEKSRLVLATLFLLQANVLLLDEPTNHLDMDSREALIAALRDYPGTIILVAHDRQLLYEVAQEVWMVRKNDLCPLSGGIEEYVHSFYKSSGEERHSPGEKRAKISSESTKEIRRRQAETRNELHRALKPLQEEFRELENRLEKILDFQGQIENSLSNPETYGDPEKIRTLNQELGDSKRESEGVFQRMSEVEEQIEYLEKERQALKQRM